jgi:transglutaminase-like putative cysteine protease
MVNMDKYLKETKMLNYSSKSIQNLISDRKWDALDEFHRILAIYNYIRDEILFGYNVSDKITASQVLTDGYGQCNTKGTLFMALCKW